MRRDDNEKLRHLFQYINHCKDFVGNSRNFHFQFSCISYIILEIPYTRGRSGCNAMMDGFKTISTIYIVQAGVKFSQNSNKSS